MLVAGWTKTHNCHKPVSGRLACWLWPRHRTMSQAHQQSVVWRWTHTQSSNLTAVSLSVCLCASAAGVDIQSEKAYQLACQGLLRPAAYNHPAFSGPVLYDIRCIQFRPPNFTLGLSVNVSLSFGRNLNKKAELSQRWPRDAPYMSAVKNFESPWVRPRLLFLKFLMVFSTNWCYEYVYTIWSS